MKKLILLSTLLVLLAYLHGHTQVRDDFRVPDLPGFITLKFDPHMHTVFSDGAVWPALRVEEAWREGLDAISITEHIEYRPHSQDVVSDHNRSYQIARPLAERMDIVLIHGSEVTRGMPPGHLNAIFLSDANVLEKDDWRDALRAARDQGAFIFWNHPGWDRQQPDTTLWWEDHTWLLENDLLHGIEVANGWLYSPEAQQWCLDHNLTMIGASDLHNPSSMDYDLGGGQRRSMTFVFARERSPEGIREALDQGRTIVYFKDRLAGKPALLEAFFRESLKVISVDRTNNRYGINLHNPTDIPLEISKAPGNDPGLDFFRQITIPPRGNSYVSVYMDDASRYSFIELKLVIDNMLAGPNEGLPVTIRFAPDAE